MDNNSKLNIKEFLDKDEQKDLLRFLTAGSVDDGKSTLIGRLLFDSKKIYEDQLDALERDSKRVGNAGEHIDYALLLDGLKAEREQGITIDVAYRYFSTNNRKFIIADTPGHEQYTRNMITGGSTANAAIILVDARTGVITQTRRHTYLISLLGIKHLVLAVNKMDLVDFDKAVFDKIVRDFEEFVAPLGIPDVTCIPLSALDGDNVVKKSERTPWYTGKCMLDYLETVPIDLDRNYDDFRYPVQYVLRPNLDFRGFCGKVASGVVRKGDTVMALPSRKTSKVKSIVTYEGEIEEAFPPLCVTITLEDEIDISRGEMIVKPDNLPTEDRNFEAMLVWMDEEAMDPNKQFYLKQTTNTTRARIEQYTRNMITGGSTANAAIILVDARTGVITQTRRHTYLISLLGIKHLVLAVNKMDLVDFDKAVFDKIVRDFEEFVAPLGIPDVTCIPLSALDGDNVVKKSERTPWYTGKCMLDYLETVPIDLDRNYDDFRYPVQYVLRPNLDFRGFCGKVASGVVRKGDTVMALPSRKTSKVKSIVTYEGEIEEAFPPLCVTITLEDEIDISRGEMIVKPDNLPTEDRNFEAMLVWMDEEAMDPNKQFYLKQTTNTTRARIDSIKYKVNVNTMEQSEVDHLELNEIGRVVFTTGKELLFDPYQKNKQTGSFILIDPITNNTSAVGMIIDRVDAKDMKHDDALATICLSDLGIDECHLEAIQKAADELKRQGIVVKVKK